MLVKDLQALSLYMVHIEMKMHRPTLENKYIQKSSSYGDTSSFTKGTTFITAMLLYLLL